VIVLVSFCCYKVAFKAIDEYYQKGYEVSIFKEALKLLFNSHVLIVKLPLYQRVIKEDGLYKKYHIIWYYAERAIKVTIWENGKLEIEV